MNQELFFNDKKYVSSKRAAQISGFAKDYIGQLCREGRINGKKIGRNWYVEEKALGEYVKSHREEVALEEGPINPVPVKVLDSKNDALKEEVSGVKLPPVSAQFLPIEMGSSVALKSLSESPSETVQKSLPFFGSIVEKISAGLVVVSLMIAFLQIAILAGAGGLWKMPNSFSVSNLAVVGEASVATVSSAKNFVGQMVYGTSEGLKAIALWTKNISGSVASVNDAPEKLPQAPDQTIDTQLGKEGVVVVPVAKIKKQIDVEKIKKTFSDEVVIKPDPEGGSGIIKPVFRNGEGDDYLYVMVPLRE